MGPYEYVSDVDLKQLIIIYDNNQQQFVVMNVVQAKMPDTPWLQLLK